jgi:hypothetical protein
MRLNKRPTWSDPQLSLDLQDFMAPGLIVEMNPEDAASLGAFEETALDETAAWDANLDTGETTDV